MNTHTSDTTTDAPLVSAHGLTKHYEGFSLEGVDLDVREGEVVGFVGKNGAGKSTTIKALLGLIATDGGTSSVLGTPSELLSRSTGVHAVTIRNILSALKKDGILFVKYGTGGATLRRPPHEITLYDICMALEPDFLSKLMGIHDEPSPLCPVGRNIHGVLEHSYEKVREDLSESLRGITLEDILEEIHL